MAQAFAAERTYLYVTTKAKKPSPEPPELLTELHTCTDTVDELRQRNRESPLFTHLSAIQEGIPALGWIVNTRPADFVKDIRGGAEYFGNKILNQYKDKWVTLKAIAPSILSSLGTSHMLNTSKHIIEFSTPS